MRDQATRTTRSTRHQVIALLATSFIASGSVAFAQSAMPLGVIEGPSALAEPVVKAPIHAAVLRDAPLLAQSSPNGPQVPNAPQRRWVARHPVILGTLIGTAGGAVLSRAETVGGMNRDPRVVLLGTGIGAWSGLVASAVQKAHAKEKVGIGAKIVIVAGAVGLIVLPVLACYGAGGCGGVS
jgi:hypothetical protein